MSDKMYYPLPEDTSFWLYYMCHYSNSTAESIEDIGDEWMTYCAGGEL